MPTSISGAVAGEGKEQCNHLALAFSIDYKISIGSYSLKQDNLCCFLPLFIGMKTG